MNKNVIRIPFNLHRQIKIDETRSDLVFRFTKSENESFDLMLMV